MSLVEEVEHGYGLSVYEYTNDLGSRDLLAEIREEAPPPLRETIDAALQPWDRRYDHATRWVGQPLRGESERGWWWFRTPAKLRLELETDLRSEGILD